MFFYQDACMRHVWMSFLQRECIAIAFEIVQVYRTEGSLKRKRRWLWKKSYILSYQDKSIWNVVHVQQIKITYFLHPWMCTELITDITRKVQGSRTWVRANCLCFFTTPFSAENSSKQILIDGLKENGHIHCSIGSQFCISFLGLILVWYYSYFA